MDALGGIDKRFWYFRCVIWSAGQASMRGSGGGASSDDNPISRARECPVAFLIS